MIGMLFGSLTTKLVGIIAAVVGALGALVGVYFKGRSSAKREARSEQMAKTIEHVETAREVERKVDAIPDAAVDDELRKHGWSRD